MLSQSKPGESFYNIYRTTCSKGKEGQELNVLKVNLFILLIFSRFSWGVVHQTLDPVETSLSQLPGPLSVLFKGRAGEGGYLSEYKLWKASHNTQFTTNQPQYRKFKKARLPPPRPTLLHFFFFLLISILWLTFKVKEEKPVGMDFLQDK